MLKMQACNTLAEFQTFTGEPINKGQLSCELSIWDSQEVHIWCQEWLLAAAYNHN